MPFRADCVSGLPRIYPTKRSLNHHVLRSVFVVVVVAVVVAVVVVAAAVAVRILTRIIKSVFTGQAPVTPEWKNVPHVYVIQSRYVDKPDHHA